MKKRWLIAACVGVLLYTVITQMPLAFLYGRLAPAGSAVELVGLEGGIARGSAAGLLLRGQPAARDLHWQLRPLPLLIGRAAFAIDGQGDGLVFDGQASVSPNQTLRLQDLRASGPVRPLLALFRVFAPIEGNAGLQLDQLTLRKGIPVDAQAHLELAGLVWKLGRNPMVLGDYVADVASGDDGIVTKINSKGGPLTVSGQALLKPDQSYELHLQIRAKADAPAPLVNLLAGLGPADTQGFHHLRRNGRLGPPSAAAP